jgi:hypothetical protein
MCWERSKKFVVAVLELTKGKKKKTFGGSKHFTSRAVLSFNYEEPILQ